MGWIGALWTMIFGQNTPEQALPAATRQPTTQNPRDVGYTADGDTFSVPEISAVELTERRAAIILLSDAEMCEGVG
ncbi:MAG: hypothetical protein WCT32_01475 [Patescibacteria group bacterium]|jgi:hypothetical protein